MVVGLEKCPAEIIESIVKLLDVTDIGNLRQTNRCLCSKATQEHFKSYFRSKRVDITGQALQKLVGLTQPGWLGCETRNLTLVGIVNNTKGLEAFLKANRNRDQKKRSRAERDLEVLQQQRRDYQQLLESGKIVRFLSETFENIAVNSVTGKLRSLSLDVTVYREDAEQRLPPATGGSWKLIWQTAAETFQVVFASLQASNLEIENLNIFNDRQLRRCSLACNELGRIDYRNEKLSKTFAALKSLSISVSQRIIEITPQDKQSTGDPGDEIDWSDDENDRDMNEVTTEAHDEQNFTGLASLLRVSNQLESLQIHQYIVNIIHIDIPNEKLFQRIAELDRLPNLEHCSLRGVFVREKDLLSFLKRMDLRSFSMENVTMTSGTFNSIFNYCTSEASRMEFLYVDDLMIQHNLLYFDGAGEPKFQTWNRSHGSNTLKREGAEIKQPILYHVTDDAPLGSPARQKWRLQQRQDFGPP